MPNLLLFSPLHRWYGEGGLEHTDLFASWSMANIKIYHPWLYHLHAIAVIWAVLAVRKLVFQAQSRFVTRRMSWMKGLQYPRANTVLVEEIPKDCRSKEQLQKFFCDNLGPDSVVCVEMVMQTKTLEDSIQLWNNAKTKLTESKGYFEREGLRPTLGRFQGFPHNLLYCFGPDSADSADALDYFTAEMAKYELQIKEMRDAINREAQKGEGDQNNQNTHSAFVTFRSGKMLRSQRLWSLVVADVAVSGSFRKLQKLQRFVGRICLKRHVLVRRSPLVTCWCCFFSQTSLRFAWQFPQQPQKSTWGCCSLFGLLWLQRSGSPFSCQCYQLPLGIKILMDSSDPSFFQAWSPADKFEADFLKARPTMFAFWEFYVWFFAQGTTSDPFELFHTAVRAPGSTSAPNVAFPFPSGLHPLPSNCGKWLPELC